MRTPLLLALLPFAFAWPTAQNRWGFGLLESLLPNSGGLLGFGLLGGNSESSGNTSTGQLCSRADGKQGDCAEDNIPIYILKTSNGGLENKWKDRCMITRPPKLSKWTKDQKKKMSLPETDKQNTRKWGLAALAVLKFILGELTENSEQTKFTIAVAEVKDITNDGRGSFVVVAGNLGLQGKNEVKSLGFGPNHHKTNNVLMRGIQQVLIEHEILFDDTTTPFIFLKNPFDGSHMNRHAEMQLTRFAKNHRLQITNLGVSKPPCCMCDTVLSGEDEESRGRGFSVAGGTNQEIKDYFTEVHSSVLLKNLEVASGPQKKQKGSEEDKVNTGLQYGFSASEFDLNLKSWHHPLHPTSWNSFGDWIEFPGEAITKKMKPDVWYHFDYNTEISLTKKHFCPGCATTADALRFSIERNIYCYKTKMCEETSENTVFVAYTPQGFWNQWPSTGIYAQGLCPTYKCYGVPKFGQWGSNGGRKCILYNGQCSAGPFLPGGHLDDTRLVCQ